MPDPTWTSELKRLGDLTDGHIREAIAAHVSPGGRAARGDARVPPRLARRAPAAAQVPAPAGKKLRPALVLLVCRGGVRRDHCASRPCRGRGVELIHNFSLVHDDIQDRSAAAPPPPRRCGRCGARRRASTPATRCSRWRRSCVLGRCDRHWRRELAAELNATALLLAEGQFLDIDLQERPTASHPRRYETMITPQNGRSVASACRLGAMAGGASTASARGLRRVRPRARRRVPGAGRPARRVGPLGRDTGKPDAADIVERKRGLPAALALSRADAPDVARGRLCRARWRHATPAGRADHRPLRRLDLRGESSSGSSARYRTALEQPERGEPARAGADYLAAICEALVSRRA